MFRVENIGYQGVEFFKVYNRWGSIVYETTDGTKGWDGSYKGQAADVGTYHYLIKLSMLVDGDTKIFKGDVTVLRGTAIRIACTKLLTQVAFNYNSYLNKGPHE